MSVKYDSPEITAIGGFDFSSLSSYTLGDSCYIYTNLVGYLYFTVM